MSVLEQVHKKKLLSKIKQVMMEDIVASLNYMIETSRLRVTPEILNSTSVGLGSFVDGYEGYYPIIEVDVIVVRYLDNYVPKVIIKDLAIDKNHDVLLEDIKLKDLLAVYQSRLFFKDKTIIPYILDGTQAERLDCMEIVRSVLDHHSTEYHIAGVSSFSKSII